MCIFRKINFVIAIYPIFCMGMVLVTKLLFRVETWTKLQSIPYHTNNTYSQIENLFSHFQCLLQFKMVGSYARKSTIYRNTNCRLEIFKQVSLFFPFWGKAYVVFFMSHWPFHVRQAPGETRFPAFPVIRRRKLQPHSTFIIAASQ